MSQQAFFTLIARPQLTNIIDKLLDQGTEIVIKVKAQYYKSKIIARRTPSLFLIYKFSKYHIDTETVTCSFELDDEKYFFKSTIVSTEAEFKINIPDEIFQLKRRSDFRVNVPLGVSYTCELKRAHLQRNVFQVELRDISLGGCQIAFPSSLLQVTVDSEFDLKIKMNQFESERIPCVSKMIKKNESLQTTLVGLQFIDPDAAFLTELQGLLVYLDRIHRGKGYE
jgi:c-di-GMP-binding flagellar brake protein YcgR